MSEGTVEAALQALADDIEKARVNAERGERAASSSFYPILKTVADAALAALRSRGSTDTEAAQESGGSMWNVRTLADAVLAAPTDRGTINVWLARDLARAALVRGSTDCAALNVSPCPHVRGSSDTRLTEALRGVAAAAWGYRVAYEAYWGEDVPGSNLPAEQKSRMLSALTGWQAELDAALAAIDDKPGDFEAAKRDHRATIASALAAARADAPQERQT